MKKYDFSYLDNESKFYLRKQKRALTVLNLLNSIEENKRLEYINQLLRKKTKWI